MVISSRQKLQSLNEYTMNIHIDGVPINQSNQSKSLGLTIDENLSWKAHIHEISVKKYPLVSVLLSGSGLFVSMHTANKIYKGLIEPQFDYCSAVWARGGTPLQEPNEMCRWMGSHLHDWSDYNGVAFSIELLE